MYEEGQHEEVAICGDGMRPPVQILEDGTVQPIVTAGGDGKGELRSDAFVGTNVFVLFDTSNYMYRGFVYASDAIADFVRGLDRADSVAVYTYSRNPSRAATLSKDRNEP